ncbi:MAG: hypothetical protein JO168_08015 [Solirubrobacterales bacterium]|nr:hypothetical protein [Solirubrobacterales bacterium]MBV9715337.1 hypothetical protein [Solirubrobacterales bacterium]
MVGSAEVELDLRFDLADLPPYEPGRGSLRGRVDFDAGRCFLAGPGERWILDGADEYQFRDGRWILSKGTPGTQPTTNPAWLLGLLARDDAVTSVVETEDGEIVTNLDGDVAGRSASAGIWPEWRMVVRLRLESGRITRMVLDTHDATSPQPQISEVFQLSSRDSLAPVELPSPESVVLGEEYIETHWIGSSRMKSLEP